MSSLGEANLVAVVAGVAASAPVLSGTGCAGTCSGRCARPAAAVSTVRLSKLRQTSQAAFVASSFSSWFSCKM